MSTFIIWYILTVDWSWKLRYSYACCRVCNLLPGVIHCRQVYNIQYKTILFILLKLKIFIPKKWHEKLMKFGMAASQLAIGALWVQLCIEEWQCIQFRSRHTEACKYNSKLRSVPPLQCESIWNIWSCVVNFKPAIAPKKIFWLLPKNSYAYKFFIAR